MSVLSELAEQVDSLVGLLAEQVTQSGKQLEILQTNLLVIQSLEQRITKLEEEAARRDADARDFFATNVLRSF